MKTTDLLKVLDEQDKENRLWLFSTSMLRILFPGESNDTLRMGLRRHVKSGVLILVKKGLYANERARNAPGDKLPAVVPYLKPTAINYLSQETRLSQLGLISQIPLNYLTLMTSGNSQTFNLDYGTVEFRHTSQAIKLILDHTEVDPETGLLVADEFLALRDLRHAGRNLDMLETT